MNRLFGRRAVSSFVLVLVAVIAVPARGEAPGAARPSDAAVRAAVEDVLRADRATPADAIGVAVEDGEVVLSGVVPSLWLANRAARLAADVRGVTAVRSRLEVRPGGEPDARVADAVRATLADDAAIAALPVRVAVEDGVVTLSGEVATWQQRSLAASLARGVPGVVEIANRLTVAAPAPRDDAAIRQDVLQALRWDSRVDSEMLEVAVERGVVTLTGTVGGAGELDDAVADAFVPGARGVDAAAVRVAAWLPEEGSGSGFRTPVAASDRDIALAVSGVLDIEPYLADSRVTVSVQDGVATLRGDVHSAEARRQASRQARQVAGVRRVVNRLRVRPEDRSDAELADAVRKALHRDARVDRFAIDVEARGGVVYLYGDVDSALEKAAADDVAARVRGVAAVRNLLRLRDRSPVAFSARAGTASMLDAQTFGVDPSRISLRPDAEIRDAIRNRLRWNALVDPNGVRVVVHDGVATLSGTVPSLLSVEAAVESAFAAGAVWVKNDLVVR